MEHGSTMDIGDIFHIVKKRMLMITVITMACALAAGVLSFYVLKPVYESSTSIIISKAQSGAETQTYNDVLMYQNLVKTYSEIAESKTVAKKTVEKLGNRYSVLDIQQTMKVSTQSDTQILTISVRNGNAQDALAITAAVSQAFVEESAEVYPNGGVIQILDEPELAVKPVKPNKKLNVAIGFVLGLLLSGSMAFMIEYMDKSIKTEEDVAKYLVDVPVMGIIPKDAKR